MLPVSIVTGFLGSGKTTLLNRVLRHPGFKDSLVVVNEFGEVGIDHLLVSAPAENVRLVANGCLCCEVRGELFETLADVLSGRERGDLPPFGRILIETSGLADPVPILRTVLTDRDLSGALRLDRVVTVVDAVHGPAQLASHAEARKQAAVADVLLLSKTDLVSRATRRDVEDAVRKINAGAALGAARPGGFDPEVLFGGSGAARDLAGWLARHGRRHASHAGDAGAVTLHRESPVSEAGLATWLSMLAELGGRDILRVKGIVNVRGAPYAIHAVQSAVHEPVPLGVWPAADDRTRIVIIGRNLDRAALERSFGAFSLAESLAGTHGIDPAAYARFRETAEHLAPRPGPAAERPA